MYKVDEQYTEVLVEHQAIITQNNGNQNTTSNIYINLFVQPTHKQKQVSESQIRWAT